MPGQVGRSTKLARAAWRMRRREATFISFNVTNRCTQRCPMCNVWRTDAEELSLDEIRRIFGELRKQGLAVVEVSGGEPLLRADLHQILDCFDELGFVYSVNTNGTLLDAEHVRKLAAHRGLLQLAISLDSLDPERYRTLRGADCLPKVLEALDLIAASRGRISAKLNFTMSRVNAEETLPMLAFAKERGLGLSVFPVMQGADFEHRSHDALFEASDTERAHMAQTFRKLAELRQTGEPLWEYSGYYRVAADFVEGKAPQTCDAGRVFFDLHADGRLAACVDLPPFADLRIEPVTQAFARVAGEAERIKACAQESPCCYTCTANVSETALHPLRFVAESARIRLRR